MESEDNFFTQEDFIKLLRRQFAESVEYLRETYPFAATIYEPAISKFHSFLLTDTELTDEKYQELKNTIHVCSSLVSNFEIHGIKNPIGNPEDDLFFGYLYSILDTILEYQESYF